MKIMHQMLKILHTSKLSCITLLVTLLFLLVACDNKHAPMEPDLDVIYDKLPAYSEINSSAPFLEEKFHNVLNQSNYQYPHGTTIVHIGEYEGFKSSAFYLNEKGDLNFSLLKEFGVTKERSELRQVYKNRETGEFDLHTGWKTSDSNGNFWIAQVRCFKPKVTQSYTWMQVHGIDGTDIILDDGTTVKSFNYPIIRLTWERYRDGIYDHIWAIVITSYPRTPKVYEWTDLGPRPDDFFNAEVHFQSNIMKVIINKTVMASYDVTYWETEPCYFKAGIYINRFTDGGEASVAFRQLRFDTNDSIVTRD